MVSDGRGHVTVSDAWPRVRESWLTPELSLERWRDRLARVEKEETTYFAGLPYVRGLAVIGSVGRGTQWPLSDLDLLAVADPWQGEDPEWPLRREESARNERLRAAKIPNPIEVGNWVLLTEEVRDAVASDDDTFLCLLDHPHWLGVVLKSAGARVVQDFDGCLTKFVDRCNRVLWSEQFVRLWRRRVVEDAGTRIERASQGLREGDPAAASLQLTLAAQAMTAGMYTVWRKLPESITRGVTRFLTAVSEAGDEEVGRHFLSAARLREHEVQERFAAAPPVAWHERDVWLAIRRGSGEHVDELAATRDLLHTSLCVAATLRESLSPPYPPWTGVSADEAVVQGQLSAAQQIFARVGRACT